MTRIGYNIQQGHANLPKLAFYATDLERKAALTSSDTEFEFVHTWRPYGGDRVRQDTVASIPMNALLMFSLKVRDIKVKGRLREYVDIQDGATEDPACHSVCEWIRTECIRDGPVRPFGFLRLSPTSAYATMYWLKRLQIDDRLLHLDNLIKVHMYRRDAHGVVELWDEARQKAGRDEPALSVLNAIQRQWEPLVMSWAHFGLSMKLLAAWRAAVKFNNDEAFDPLCRALNRCIQNKTALTPFEAQRILDTTKDGQMQEAVLDKVVQALTTKYGSRAIAQSACRKEVARAGQPLRSRIEARLRTY